MKATGIVRRIDDLGRVVIPKEIRRTMHIGNGAQLEIFTGSDGEVVFKKYSPVAEISEVAAKYASNIGKMLKATVAISDMEHIVSASGTNKRDLLGLAVPQGVEKLLKERQNASYEPRTQMVDRSDYCVRASLPVIANSEVIGAVLLLQNETETPVLKVTESEIQALAVAASLISVQFEE